MAVLGRRVLPVPTGAVSQADILRLQNQIDSLKSKVDTQADTVGKLRSQVANQQTTINVLNGQIAALSAAQANFATKTEIAGLAKKGDLAAFVKTSDLNTRLANHALKADLTGLARTTDLVPFAKTADLGVFVKLSSLPALDRLTFVSSTFGDAGVAKANVRGYIDTAFLKERLGTTFTDLVAFNKVKARTDGILTALRATGVADDKTIDGLQERLKKVTTAIQTLKDVFSKKQNAYQLNQSYGVAFPKTVTADVPSDRRIPHALNTVRQMRVFIAEVASDPGATRAALSTMGAHAKDVMTSIMDDLRDAINTLDVAQNDFLADLVKPIGNLGKNLKNVPAP